MTILDQIAGRIIREQELIIGPIAWSEANKVVGVRVIDQGKAEIEIEGEDKKQVIDMLVARYERLFGRASHEVCREAAGKLLASLQPAEIPQSLQ